MRFLSGLRGLFLCILRGDGRGGSLLFGFLCVLLSLPSNQIPPGVDMITSGLQSVIWMLILGFTTTDSEQVKANNRFQVAHLIPQRRGYCTEGCIGSKQRGLCNTGSKGAA